MIEDVPFDAVQNIRLILVGIETLMKFGLARWSMLDLCVVPRGHEITAELLTKLPQLAELEPIVADNTGVGRSSFEVFISKVVDDLPEFLFKIERIKRNPEFVGDPSRIPGIDGGAASFFAIGPLIVGIGVRTRAHEQTDNVVPLPLQQHRGDGAIDAATHCQNHTPSHHVPH